MLKKEIVPDPYQKEAVEIDKNAVVSAGAGAGKTTVLANRYMRLILEGKAGVENILALTFTRKAAREMRTRIYGLLLENSDVPRVKEQIALFERSQISTLDSFCSQIARNWTQRFGVSSDFRVDEEGAVDEAGRVSLEFMLEKSDDPALAELIYINGFEQVLEKFLIALARSHITVAGDLDFTSMFDMQKRILAEELQSRISMVDDTVQAGARLDPGSRVAMKNAVAAIGALENVRPLADAGQFEALEELIGNFKMRKPSPAADPNVETMRQLIDALRRVLAELSDLIATRRAEPLTMSLFNLTAEFQNRIIATRRQSGLLFYHDVAQMARICLLENVGLRRYYKNRFTHVMIDEFQDNNKLQKEILYLLAEKRNAEGAGVPRASELDPDKLFFVGDEKQSIYLFRGADVSVFKELAGEIEKEGGKALSLPRNYRTEPGLIDFFNTVFSSLMSDADRSFEARFEPLEYRKAMLKHPPSIRILYKAATEGKDDILVEESDAEAIAVARYIKDVVQNGMLEVKEGDTIRPAGYGDFALLMRSTSNQSRYEQTFRMMGIPHTVDSTRSLFLESPINDIYNLLQLVVYPDDRLAYAAVLRSPFCNVSDRGFLTVLLAAEPPFAEQAVQNGEIDVSDSEKLSLAAGLYEEMSSKADRVPITELLALLWYRFGYRYVLLKDPLLHSYLEYYHYMRELARSADKSSASLARFLDMIRPHIGRYERLGDLDVLKDDEQSGTGVQILTVHRAKGLEFPVVILADAGNRGRSSVSSEPFYFTDEYGLTFNVVQDPGGQSRKGSYFYARGKDEQQQKDIAETKRVLYVALTRAEYHLVISGRHNARNRSGEGVPLNMVLTSLGWEPGTDVTACTALDPFLEMIPDVPVDLLRSFRTVTGAGNAPSVETAFAVYQNAALPGNRSSPAEWSATELESRATREWASVRELPALSCDAVLTDAGLEAEFGTLCHSIIEHTMDGDSQGFHVPAALRVRLDKDALGSVIREATHLTAGFFGSPGAKLLEGAIAVDTEVPFLMLYERNGREAYISGVIDLMIDRGEETVIIDFKTDRLLRQGEYHIQTEIYREAASQLTTKPVRCFLVYLRDNSLVEIPHKPLPDFFE